MDNFRDSYFQINWDLCKRRLNNSVWGKQYDTGRGLAITIKNNGVDITPTNEIIRLKWEKSDKTAGYVNSVIVGNEFIIENIDQMFTVAGMVKADLELWVAGEVVSSVTFYVAVDKAVAVDAIESSSEFTALQEALNEVNTVQGELDTYTEAEALRVTAETSREGAEGLRATAFTEAQTDRATTFTATEQARATTFSGAENARQTAEGLRVAAESGRVNAEQTRATAEIARQDIYTSKAEKTYTDAELAKKADKATTYTKTEVDNVTNPLATRVTAIEANFKQYGVRRVLGATSPLLERIYDAVGKTAQVPTDDGIATNDFDNIYPWSHIKEVKIANGRVIYKTDPTYASLTACDWMVEIPKFYLKIEQDATKRDIIISRYKGIGFWCPQAFKNESGAELDKIYVGRFKTGIDGASDVSRPAYFPENFRDLASFRTGVRAKGAGWQQIDLSYVQEVLHPLYLVESATLNSQDYLGAGMTSFRYAATDTAQLAETAVNRIVVTNVAAANYNVGENICIGTSQGSENIAKDLTILSKTALVDGVNTEIVFDGPPITIALGNILWQGAQKCGQTVSLTKPNGKLSGASGRRSNKYRGLEDTFGNVYEWVDGVLISDLVSQVCRKPSLYASALTADYKPAGYANIDVNGYPKEMGWDENFPEARFPISVGAGTTTGYCDNYYQAIGLRGAFFGGSASHGTSAGLFYWGLNHAPTGTHWFFGSRLLFKPPV